MQSDHNTGGTIMNILTQFQKKLILPSLITLALIVLPMPASATPSCGISTLILSLGHYASGSLDLACEDEQFKWELETKVKGDSDVYVIQNTFAPGTHSGWHTHPGPSLITVVSGELTVYDAADLTCTPRIYKAGDSFTDIGCGDVHLIRNEGNQTAVNTVVQILPKGAPRRIDKPAPGNCPIITCP
jgi:quercetin dioxygenase-like cupin family protein